MGPYDPEGVIDITDLDFSHVTISIYQLSKVC
jgi:hypothetical protein